VALDADDKTRLRFSRLDNRHIEPLITAALAHFHSPTGDIAEEDMPEDLRQRLSARSPPRIGG
jgi:predicted metal-binding protein